MGHRSRRVWGTCKREGVTACMLERDGTARLELEDHGSRGEIIILVHVITRADVLERR